eukprot:TRINITY_DN12152_c0_g1_i1.p1 TRINITY_DN12152_c0_g1~~TRINITY_DN12152_c0_g1_i1.p1  ORF type:complete len:111 (+),score=0.94 TRINITY_DN12152_c0_g1_i1:75-407(+)
MKTSLAFCFFVLLIAVSQSVQLSISGSNNILNDDADKDRFLIGAIVCSVLLLTITIPCSSIFLYHYTRDSVPGPGYTLPGLSRWLSLGALGLSTILCGIPMIVCWVLYST